MLEDVGLLEEELHALLEARGLGGFCSVVVGGRKGGKGEEEEKGRG